MEHPPEYHLLTHYGYPGLFAALALGIVGLPVPDETLLTAAGFLLRSGDLSPAPVFIAAATGTICGITCSYILGRTLGIRLLHQASAWLHLDQPAVARFHNWFEKRGYWTLVLGYFIPGLRHLVAIGAGSAKLPWHSFALFAYTGAIIWVTTFLTAGYALGSEWHRARFGLRITITATGAGLLLALLIAGYLRRRRRRKLPPQL